MSEEREKNFNVRERCERNIDEKILGSKRKLWKENEQNYFVQWLKYLKLISF